jgi:hypothetical protein
MVAIRPTLSVRAARTALLAALAAASHTVLPAPA